MIEKNPFVEVPEKQMERLWNMARPTASLGVICSDQPYEEEKAEKLKNGVMKLNQHNGVILACIGWSTMDSFFLGSMISMSSTTIIIKAFDDLNIKKQKFTDLDRKSVV